MIQFMLALNKEGKLRLSRWYGQFTLLERENIVRELGSIVLKRDKSLCRFVEWRDYKVAYQRYSSLYFICAVDLDDNEISVLELIHQYVITLDRHFESVCELDIIYGFADSLHVWDIFVVGGEIAHVDSREVLFRMQKYQEHEEEPFSLVSWLSSLVS